MDVSGVATGGVAPRIYYRKNAGAYVSQACSLSSGTVTNTGTSAVVLAIQSGAAGARNNTLRNLNVLGQDPTTTLAGIALGGATPGTAGTDNDNNRIENCTVKRVIYGIYSAGQNAANPNTGTVITQNDLSATAADRVRRVGIVVFNEDGVQITENSVGGLDTNESADAVAIGVGSQGLDNTTVTVGGITNALVSRNRIAGVISASTTGFSAAGIVVAGAPGGANTVVNNMISGVTSPATAPDLVAGIFVAGVAGSSTRVFDNSVSMSGDRGAVASQTPSFALAITGADPTVELKGNAFATTQISSGGGVNAKSYAIGMVSATFTNLDSNFNDFFASGANAGFFRSGSLGAGTGTDYATVGAWSVAVSDDVNSLQVDPLFVSTSDLHLQPSSTLAGAGTPIAGVTVDFDNEPRSATSPTLGADELAADLSITKTDGVASVTPGGSTTYTITAGNAGPGGSAGTVADTFPAVLTCTWTCVGAGGGTCTAAGAGNINDAVNLPAGASVTYTAICGISLSASGSLSNTATVAGVAGDPNGANNSATDTDTVLDLADLAITKTDGVAGATPGGMTTYTITASNAGPSATTATVADTFPASLTCTWTCVGAGGGTCTAAGAGNINDGVSLPSGGSVTYTASCAISAAATGSLSNTATVGGVAVDPVPGNNSATDTDTLTGQADIAVTKTVDNAAPGLGTNVVFTVTATNNGPSNATGVTLSDLLPAGLVFVSAVPSAGSYSAATGVWTLGTLANAAAATLTVTATVNRIETLVNTASKSGQNEADPNPGNNTATVGLNGGALIDIAVSETVDNPAPGIGQDVFFLVQARNAGPNTANLVTIEDNLPAGLTFVGATPSQGTYTAGTGTWNVGTLGPLATATLTVQMTNTVNTPVTRTVEKTSSTEPDLVKGNDAASVVLNPSGASVDLALTKITTQEPVGSGLAFHYVVVVTNLGSGNATGVVMTDDLPAGVTLQSATPSQGSCSGTTTVTCNLGNLLVGGSATIDIVVTKNDPGPVTNTASVVGNEADPNPDNNSNVATTTPVELMSFSVD